MSNNHEPPSILDATLGQLLATLAFYGSAIGIGVWIGTRLFN